MRTPLCSPPQSLLPVKEERSHLNLLDPLVMLLKLARPLQGEGAEAEAEEGLPIAWSRQLLTHLWDSVIHRGLSWIPNSDAPMLRIFALFLVFFIKSQFCYSLFTCRSFCFELCLFLAFFGIKGFDMWLVAVVSIEHQGKFHYISELQATFSLLRI